MSKSVQTQVGNEAVARRLAHLTNNTLRDLMGSSSLGPKPYKRLRPPQQPGQKAKWEIRHSYVGKFSTGFDEDQEFEADLALEAYTNKFYNKQAGLIEAHLIEIDKICEAEIERLEAKIAGGQKLTRGEVRTLHVARIALVPFAGVVVYDLDQDAMDRFIDFLCGQGDRDGRNRKLPAPPVDIDRHTAIQYGRRLLALIRNIKLPPGAIPWRCNVRIKDCYVPRVTLLDEHEVARLLMSLYRGWIWEDATGTWRTEQVVDAATGEVMTRRVRAGWVADTFDPEMGRWNWSIPEDGAPGLDKDRKAKLDKSAGRRRALVRYCLIYLYTGTRDVRIRALKWRADKYNGWIAPLPDGTLSMRRLGLAERSRGTKRADETELPDGLALHVRRWMRMAKKTGCPWVTPDETGGPIKWVNSHFDVGVALAGLSHMDVTPHTLKHCCVTWALDAGWTIRDIARLTSTTPEVLRRVYEQWFPQRSRNVTAYPRSVRQGHTLH